MKLTAHIGDENHEVNIERNGERVVAQIDGRSHEISVCEVADGNYVLIRNGNVYECLVERKRDQPGTLEVHVRNRSFVTTVTDPRQLRGAHRSGAHAVGGAAQISSPMAGKVVRVLVDQGATVKAGDGIVVVEAMKMQNELKSPYDGVVTEIRAEKGSTVNAGEVLAIVEAHV